MKIEKKKHQKLIQIQIEIKSKISAAVAIAEDLSTYLITNFCISTDSKLSAEADSKIFCRSRS
jgi:hypothetical protein